MEKDLIEYYEKLVEDKKKGFLSVVVMVEEKIDGKVREAIRVRSDEFGKREVNKIPETLSMLPFGDSQETLGYAYIFCDREKQLEEESLADLVARV